MAESQPPREMYYAGYTPVILPPPTQTNHSVTATAAAAAAVMIKQVINDNNTSGNSDSKKKRGRPRKYGPDSSVVAPHSFSLPMEQVGGENVVRKAMGRPRGSKNKKQRKSTEFLGSNGNKFVPHILNVLPGEDVAQRIMTFSHSSPRAVCILSGSGALASVALSQAATSGGIATYEGRFEILSLSGSFIPTETGDHRSRSGGLSITLVGTGGRVFGGCVSSFLIAATPVQLLIGSFVTEGFGEPRLPNHMEPSSANQGGTAGLGSSPSLGTQSESSGEPASHHNFGSGGHHNFGSGAFNNVPQGGMFWK